MKKVLIFSTAYIPFVGGAEVAVKEITDRIGSASPQSPARDYDGLKFGMITARMDRKLAKFERIGNVNVYRVGFGLKILDKFLLPFLGLIKALELQRENKYDIAWPIMASQASIAAAFFKIFKPKIKLILTLQEGDEEEHLKRYAFGSDLLYKIFIQPWHLLVFKKAGFITAISNDLKQRALRSGAKGKVEVVPNGVSLNQFSITNYELRINDFRDKLGIKSGEKVIITTSRLVEKNGIGDLIDAVNELRITNYELKIKLLILGSGELEEKLKLLVASCGLRDKVLFLGQVPHSDLPKYLWMSDVFCRPSLSEGLGNSFLEAMAAGIPVIAAPVGGIPDFLIDNQTGWFCKVKNPKSIAEKINYILDEKNKEEVSRVVENAKKLVEEKYNWDKIAVKFKEILNKL